MGQASSAQREPSMEEILASIRRIIEDSDSGQAAPEAESPLPRQANDDGRPSAGGQSFAAHIEPSGGGRAWPADEDEAPEPVDSASPEAGETREGQALGDFRESDEEGATRSPRAPSHSQPPRMDGDEPRGGATQAAGVSQRPAALDDDGAGQTAASSGQTATDAAGSAGAPPAILSEPAGRKVAAAFGELNEVLQKTRRQSLDQMAEEMLRPLLQEWLDNNLPTLVERLVREEIERVARGG